MSEWQPIEAAPKDGTLVDLIVNGDRITDCKFINGSWMDYDKGERCWCWSGDPSHWMPIPKLPSAV